MFKNVILSTLLLSFIVSIGAIDATALTLEEKIDSLFVIASSGEVRFRDQNGPAMDSIAALGQPAVPYMIDKFTTRSARKRLTVIWVLTRIGSVAVPDLVVALKRPEGIVVQRICWALGDIKDSSAVPGLIGVANHNRWQVRDQALTALGKIKDTRAVMTINSAFKDSIGQVRKAAAVASGQLAMNDAIQSLVHQLGDDFYGARMTALSSLLKLDTTMVIAALSDSIGSANRLTGDLGCQLLGEIGTNDAIELLIKQLADPSGDRRAHAAVALIKADPLDNCGLQDEMIANESDRLTKLKILSALRTIQNEGE